MPKSKLKMPSRKPDLAALSAQPSPSVAKSTPQREPSPTPTSRNVDKQRLLSAMENEMQSAIASLTTQQTLVADVLDAVTNEDGDVETSLGAESALSACSSMLAAWHCFHSTPSPSTKVTQDVEMLDTESLLAQGTATIEREAEYLQATVSSWFEGGATSVGGNVVGLGGQDCSSWGQAEAVLGQTVRRLVRLK